jgi:hypothetical protein
MPIMVARIDDGQRAKIVCTECGCETYVPVLGELDEVLERLATAGNGHYEAAHA